MAGAAPELAQKENGDVRLDYYLDGASRIRLWEPMGKSTLETTFRPDGAVLLQVNVDTRRVGERIKETLLECGSAAPVKAEYRDVTFEKACPWCSKRELVRFAQAYRSSGEVPVMPLYHCRGCRGRSYYLTDEYLIHLISSNPGMFESPDVQRFNSDPGSFVAEMKAYVISSFASKKVRRID